MDFNKMLKQAQEMQKKVQEMKDKLKMLKLMVLQVEGL